MRLIIFCSLIFILGACCKAVRQPGEIVLTASSISGSKDVKLITYEGGGFDMPKDTTDVGNINSNSDLILEVFEEYNYRVYLEGSVHKFSISNIQIERGRCGGPIKELSVSVNGSPRTENSIDLVF